MQSAIEYVDEDSFIHRLNPLTKMFGLLVIFALGLVYNNPFILFLVILLVIAIVFIAKSSAVLHSYIKPLLYAGIFILVLQLFFSHDGPELIRFIPRRIPILGWLGSINKDSLLLGLTMVTRMVVFGLSLPLLMATTQPRDLVLALVEKLRFPYKYAFMFITSLRFIPTLFVELETIIQAQNARAFDMNGKSPVARVKAYIPLVMPLVIIALKKAEQLAVAMETRGYGLGPRSYYKKLVFNYRDLLVCAGCVIFMTIAIITRMKGIGG